MKPKEGNRTIVLLVVVFLIAVAALFAPSIVAASEPEMPEPTIHPPVVETPSPMLLPITPALKTDSDVNAEAEARLGPGETESQQTSASEPAHSDDDAFSPAEEENNAAKYHRCDDVRLTAYCSCEICCGAWALGRPVDAYGNEIVYTSTGALAMQGVTVAVDPEFIPHGSYVYVQDPVSGAWREYRATDTSPVYNHVDIYYSDHAAAWNSGYGGYGTVYWSAEPVDVGALERWEG